MMLRGIYRIFKCFYDVVLVCAFVIALPKLLYKMVVYGKYKKSLATRFGLKKPQVPGNGPLVWFHGASVGEVRLLLPVVEKFFQEFPGWRCIVTSCTELGEQVARQVFSPMGVTVSILPLDFSVIIKPLVRKLHPSLVVFSEGDCWLNFIEEAKRVGATTLVINGKISLDSSKRFSFLKRLGKNYFSPVDEFLLQDEVQKQRFLSLGIPESKLHVTGNIKTYFKKQNSLYMEREIWRERLGLTNESKLIVLGSMHRSDAEKWLPAVQKLVKENVSVLWVPRHIEKTKDIEETLSRFRIPYGLWSRGANFSYAPVVLVDEIGLLKQLYAAGDLAFVGGTFDPKIGGHNLLEPLQCEVPLLFGPFIASQSELAQRLLLSGAGLCLEGTEPIFNIVSLLIHDIEARESYIQKGKAFLKTEEIAFDRTWNALKSYIPLYKNS
ncbi:3-deoxy-D-manno-octulosonic-acid transferase,3-deoxy-D-manno-octulosonic-acid transferase,3-Deoxy-D-manno-octulosonic-acid transferase (kdotransferase) [Chlamydia serpentis]|uniref:3-deoxy-D-manno-octulosonic acid transferase n=1 Tax=Chlamydia serpentis TaxID=1967782 RepID=A0A2R8FA72_9CHLA|nr:lipid IV(A) 3-deoxy-D-manno-octulosonic acid transferase [Chlamydia serpentis]SPN73315.1 3-deoxy-D-manno-octulosonic-acid transferase,3-deoxy-D-manno-octulosonic-acid transferase,3-Deoxy-D-manno-octulosonic-acid transferase (kdotransferase) [Chlamydia serpentis]